MKELKIDKWIYILDAINRKGIMSQTGIATETKTTFAHIHNTIRILKADGFVSTRKSGQELLVGLTKKGKLVADTCSILVSRMRN